MRDIQINEWSLGLICSYLCCRYSYILFMCNRVTLACAFFSKEVCEGNATREIIFKMVLTICIWPPQKGVKKLEEEVIDCICLASLLPKQFS